MGTSSSRTFGRGNENGFAQLFRHASTRDAAKYIGKPGEITYDPCSHTLIVHNGCSAGGCDKFVTLSLGAIVDLLKTLPVVATTCVSVPVNPPSISAQLAVLPAATSAC
jgi:ribonucleotide monophosphatase NagD (HAD superfamily)